jgi:protein-disulfide isomerase
LLDAAVTFSMKRLLPFLIIAVVALLTVGLATLVYRVKTQAAPVTAGSAATKPTPAQEAEEDPSLHVRGPRNAPVTLEIYGDFQCPPCATASKAIDELQKQDEGKIRVIYHEFPLKIHQHAMEAAMAAEAAGIQGKFWEMHDMLYQFQPVWSRVTNARYFFESYAESLKLDVARFRADCQAADLRARIMVEGKVGETRGAKNTPTIFINGTEAKGAFTKEKLQKAIDATLAAKKNS